MSAIEDLATELSRLPGIGRKTALRLTYHLLRQPVDQSRRLAQALLTLGERVRPCARCFNLTEDDVCSICRDPRRDASTICVVEQASEAELAAFLRAVGQVAKQEGVVAGGYRILANHGAVAHQEVPHFHLHLFGGRDLGPMLRGGR